MSRGNWISLGLGIGAWMLGAREAHAEPGVLAPMIYSGLAAGDLLTRRAALERGAGELNPLLGSGETQALAVTLAGTGLVIWGDSQLKKPWQRWSLRLGYGLWTAYKMRANMKAHRIERIF